MAAKRQRASLPAGVPSPTPPEALPIAPVRAARPPLLSLAAWAAQVQALPAACNAALQLLMQLEPGLMRDAIAGRSRASVSEVQVLVARSQACSKQAATVLAELEVCQQRLVQVMPAKQP